MPSNVDRCPGCGGNKAMVNSLCYRCRNPWAFCQECGTEKSKHYLGTVQCNQRFHPNRCPKCGNWKRIQYKTCYPCEWDKCKCGKPKKRKEDICWSCRPQKRAYTGGYDWMDDDYKSAPPLGSAYDAYQEWSLNPEAFEKLYGWSPEEYYGDPGMAEDDPFGLYPI